MTRHQRVVAAARLAAVVAFVLVSITHFAIGQSPRRETVRAIVGAASHTNARGTDSLSIMLARIPGILGGLLSLAGDTSEVLLDRMNALGFVGDLRTPEAFRALASFADSASDGLLRRGALSGLAAFGSSPEVLAVLERFLSRPTESDREAAAVALLIIAVRKHSPTILPTVDRALAREHALGVRQALERARREAMRGP